MFGSSSRPYPLRKSRHILRDRYRWYEQHGHVLDNELLLRVEKILGDLDQATCQGDRKEADRLARELESIKDIEPVKTKTGYFAEIILALIVALSIATVVRQVWFEPYKIPTGSMRPTFEEQDHLIVSKTAFGINVPLRTAHFYFDPDLVQRGGVVIWSGEGIDLPDTDTIYFWLFPGKKRYIKRCMGLPGDALYFYGGKIYGVDASGQDVTAELNRDGMEKLDYVPFNTFEGRITANKLARETPMYQVLFRHMNKALGRFNLSAYGSGDGEIFVNDEWTKEDPSAAGQRHNTPQVYSDFLGIRNYAMARVLTKEQVKSYTDVDAKNLEEAALYLELRHNPNLTDPKPRAVATQNGGVRVLLTPYVAMIPLHERHLDALADSLYTTRFVVKSGHATSWQIEGSRLHSGSPELPGVPDGTYEFYYGKGYEMGWGGSRTELPSDHPLYSRDPANLQLLFNLGVEFNTAFNPWSADQVAYPSRYAYFRDGDLYVMGSKVYKKDDPTLQYFVDQEVQRQTKASGNNVYVPFVDQGPPLNEDGSIDIELIRASGVIVPDNHYLVLGDNHARSADSRTFGFVPEQNIQGAPSYIIWPMGERFGSPNQGAMPWITLPKLIVWLLVGLAIVLWALHDRKQMREPLFKKIHGK